MNETIRTQLAHRTIREFTGEPIPEETMQTLFDVAVRTSTSRGFQQAVLIRVKDQAKRDELARIGNQPYIARAPELLVGVLDVRRGVRILDELGEPSENAANMVVFREAFTDTVLMIQNVSVAAETLGLGVSHLGSVLNDYAAAIDVLELPKYTFPVLGMMLGYPNQEPQLKPRMDKSFRVHTDVYQEPESWTDSLKEYDAQMHTYYDLRDANRRVDQFTTQIARKFIEDYDAHNPIPHMLAQGFDLGS